MLNAFRSGGTAHVGVKEIVLISVVNTKFPYCATVHCPDTQDELVRRIGQNYGALVASCADQIKTNCT
jgi:hypothetical protein